MQTATAYYSNPSNRAKARNSWNRLARIGAPNPCGALATSGPSRGKIYLYDSETSKRLSAKELGITREQYLSCISMSEGVAGEGHVRPDCLRETAHPRVYSA